MSLKTLIGLFPDMEQAAGAVQNLENIGFNAEDMLLVTEEGGEELSNMLLTEPESQARKGAAIGGSTGTTLGLLGGASLVTLTGFGVLVAGGLIGAASGLTVGSYLGAIYGSRTASQVLKLLLRRKEPSPLYAFRKAFWVMSSAASRSRPNPEASL